MTIERAEFVRGRTDADPAASWESRTAAPIRRSIAAARQTGLLGIPSSDAVLAGLPIRALRVESGRTDRRKAPRGAKSGGTKPVTGFTTSKFATVSESRKCLYFFGLAHSDVVFFGW